MLGLMADFSDAPLDSLWKEYGRVFRDFDDSSLARWLAQTLGQLEGRAWRLSHPLVGAYRLGAQAAHDRQIWHKRLATPPPAYRESPCCRAPLLPLFSRDVLDTGLACLHCGDTCVPFDEIPTELQNDIRRWAEDYARVHAVAHWDDNQRRQCGNYDAKYEQAAEQAEQLLSNAGRALASKFIEHFPSVVWEDQDECLEVRPEDVPL
jgi:hypothetical protein